MVQVSALMALSNKGNLTVRKSHARNEERVNITMRKVNILISMDDDSDWQSCLNYINVDLKLLKSKDLICF